MSQVNEKSEYDMWRDERIKQNKEMLAGIFPNLKETKENIKPNKRTVQKPKRQTPYDRLSTQSGRVLMRRNARRSVRRVDSYIPKDAVLQSTQENSSTQMFTTANVTSVKLADNVLTCPDCSFLATKTITMQQHKIVHDTGPPFKCPVCSCIYSGQTAITQYSLHISKHYEDKPFLCAQCDKSFSTNSAANGHVRMHWGTQKVTKEANFKLADNVLTCPDCSFLATKTITMQQHKIVHDTGPPFTCPVCCRVFSKHHYNRHIHTHYEDKPFLCVKCDKSFCTDEEANGHAKRMHGDPRLSWALRNSNDVPQWAYAPNSPQSHV